MGNRANVQFVDQDGRVNLYAHWMGATLAAVVHKHLQSEVCRDRWTDGPYATRIIIHRTLNELGDPESSTGFGISAGEPPDNDGHPILVLDFVNGTAELGNLTWTFEKFCELGYDVVRQLAE